MGRAMCCVSTSIPWRSDSDYSIAPTSIPCLACPATKKRARPLWLRWTKFQGRSSVRVWTLPARMRARPGPTRSREHPRPTSSWRPTTSMPRNGRVRRSAAWPSICQRPTSPLSMRRTGAFAGRICVPGRTVYGRRSKTKRSPSTQRSAAFSSGWTRPVSGMRSRAGC